MFLAFRESLRIHVPLALTLLLSLLFLHGLFFWFVTGLAGFLIGFTIYFFRDPHRVIPEDPRAIVAAADGLVVAVDECQETPFKLGRTKRVAIFLSVFDVHINRSPASGTVEKIEHTPGAFLDVRHPDSSLKNEHQDWLLKTSFGPMVVRQIAGLVARRIVGWSTVESVVAKGERIGMIRFGSRTELYFSPTFEVTVAVGERVFGGRSIIARWPAT